MNIITERLLIRPIQINDKNDLFEYRSDAQTNQYQGWIPQSIEDAEAFINKTSKEINIPETWFQLVIINQGSNEIIGDIGIHFVDSDNKQVELGCTLSKANHGKGYATEALKAVINYLFKELHKHKIITSIDPENVNSIKLVERIGFRKEAHFKESLYLNGRWVDDLVYAILSKEWNL